MRGIFSGLRSAPALLVAFICASCGSGGSEQTSDTTTASPESAGVTSRATTAIVSPPSGNEICGTGSTFSVTLPGRRLGRDPSTEDLSDRTLPDDSIKLPAGCDVYTLIVHGYGRNSLFDELMYYKLAKWTTEHNGYVHWSWWNNLLAEYMSRPLHVIPGQSRGDKNYPSPGDITKNENVWDFAQGGSGKAVPDEDFQFQDDAEIMLERIREENPNAIVIVAGHSMGGNAVARLGSNTTVAIDLLAPIDPVGNRNLPEGQGGALQYSNGNKSAVPGEDGYERGNETFNWTRWRATRNFAGWTDRDCVRNAVNLCRDFDERLFKVEYRCRTLSTSHDLKPASDGPIADKWCPDDYPYGIVSFRSNIRRLYHRWQKEAYFPYDWDANHHFRFAGVTLHQDVPFDPKYHHYQRAVGEYARGDLPLASLPATKTCQFKGVEDPSGAESFEGTDLDCQDWDGHGEIIGMRGTKERPVLQNVPPQPTKANLNPLALTADWKQGRWERESPWSPSVSGATSSPAGARRQALIEMATPGEWTFAPKDPDLDLVGDDLVKIAEDIWAHRGAPSGPDVTPPTSSADVTPEPTTHGWNNSAVIVEISAVDEAGGSGVKEIAYTLTGASTGSAVVAGAEVSIEIRPEGVTTLSFFARDNANNQETSNTVEVRIDLTPPTIDASVAPPPNATGWNNTDVTVTFEAHDALSGIDTVTQPVTLTDEGANQEVVGVATDRAGNTASVGVVVNIDKTPPLIGGLPDSCELWPPNHKLVGVADVVVSDNLSGVAGTAIEGTSSEPESGPGYGNAAPDVVIDGNHIELRAERYSPGGRTYDLAVTARDRADNVAEAEATCHVPHDQGH